MVIVGGTAVVPESVRERLGVLVAGVEVERLAGADRVETAALVAGRVLGGRLDATVVLAYGWSPADVGVAASFVAGGGADAVLYVQQGSLGDAAAGSVRGRRRWPRWSPSAALRCCRMRCFRLGLTRRVCRRRVVWAVRRVSTPLRARPRAAGGDCTDTVVVANGWVDADVGVAASLAAALEHSGVLYAESADVLGETAMTVLDRLAPVSVVLVGGTDALSETLAGSLTAGTPRNVTRIEGAVAAAQHALAHTATACDTSGGGGRAGARSSSSDRGGGTGSTVTPRDDIDPTLSALTVSPGTLAPAFAAATLAYTVEVAHDVAHLTVTHTAAGTATSTVTGTDADPNTEGHQVALRQGANVITVRVTATDGIASRTYLLTVTRTAPTSPGDATLSSLAVSVGTAISFDAETEWYWVSDVAADATTATLTWTPTDSNAAVAVSPADSDSGASGHQIALTGPRAEATLIVTSADDAVVRTYTVSLHRKVEWVKVQSGWDHVCGLRSNGQAVCWGWQVYGQPRRSPPLWAPAGNVYRDLFVGRTHSCGSLVTGEFNCWTDFNTPSVSDIGPDIIAVDAKAISPICWVKDGGALRCKNNVPPQVRDGRYQTVTTGLDIACALDMLGGIVCWNSWRNWVLPTPGGTYTFISARKHGVCGIRSDGSLICWQYRSTGFDRRYDILREDTTRSYRWADPMYYAGVRNDQCGVTTDGDVVCRQSELSRTGDYTMVTSAFGPPLCAVTEAGKVECWDPWRTSTSRSPWTPPSVDADADIRHLSIGGVQVPVSRKATAYSINVAASTATADVAVQPYAASAGVAITPADSDATATGHQATLTTGQNTVTVTITSENQATTKTYTITVTRASS